jgi:hypothetical protein
MLGESRYDPNGAHIVAQDSHFDSSSTCKLWRGRTSPSRSWAKVPVYLVFAIMALQLTAASWSAAQDSTPVPEKNAGNASTCFLYRYRLARGSLEKIGIFIDGVRAVNLVNGRWVSIQVPAGHHVITTKDKVSGAEIDMEPGASYYLWAGWGEQGLLGSTHQLVAVIPKEQATYEIHQLDPLDAKDISWPPESRPASKK